MTVNRTSEYIDKEVYTDTGLYIGVVEDAIVGDSHDSLESLGIIDVNPLLDELTANNSPQSKYSIPVRWIKATDDIIIIVDMISSNLQK